MSVCIAAICTSHDPKEARNKRIFAVADMKMSSVESSNDQAAVKGLWLPYNWTAFIAGNDISPAVPIVDAVAAEMAHDTGKPNTLQNWMAIFESAYQKHLASVAEARVLSRWRLTMKQFYENGREKFGEDVFDKLCHAIETVKLECTFMVVGFDDNDTPHIFTVRNPGIAECRDVPGFWAIGTGDFAAMSMLGFFRQNDMIRLAHTIYHVYAAKFMAEGADGVGQKTWGWIHYPYGTDFTELKLERDVREFWSKQFKREMPVAAHEPIFREIDRSLRTVIGRVRKQQREERKAKRATKAAGGSQ